MLYIFNESKRNTGDIGFIAQEIEELIVYKTIKYERLILYLLVTIQHLRDTIKILILIKLISNYNYNKKYIYVLYIMSGNNLKVVNTNNWYQKMNIYGTNSGIITITGTDPSMQMLLITAANDVNYCSSNYQLSKSNGFTLTFQLYLTGSNFNSICAYFGATDSTSSFDANDGLSGQSGAVSLMIRSNVVRLYTNYGTNTIAASSDTSIGTNAWQTITVTYTPSVTNTWTVALNGTNIITYSDSSYTTFASNQNTLWGFYGATSQTVSASIRSVDLGVKQSMPMSVLKNTYSFYPEECFINKLIKFIEIN